MKSYTMSGTLSLAQVTGRIPTPKKGGAMKPKKGKGAYTRADKYKKKIW